MDSIKLLEIIEDSLPSFIAGGLGSIAFIVKLIETIRGAFFKKSYGKMPISKALFKRYVIDELVEYIEGMDMIALDASAVGFVAFHDGIIVDDKKIDEFHRETFNYKNLVYRVLKQIEKRLIDIFKNESEKLMTDNERDFDDFLNQKCIEISNLFPQHFYTYQPHFFHGLDAQRFSDFMRGEVLQKNNQMLIELLKTSRRMMRDYYNNREATEDLIRDKIAENL